MHRVLLGLLCVALICQPLIASADASGRFDPSAFSRKPTVCDSVAAHPQDPNKVAPGLERVEMDLPKAIRSCHQAVARDVDNPRLQYQLGRALTYSMRVQEALPHLQKAAQAGYPQAQFVLGYLYLEGEYQAPRDACKALGLLRASAEQGRMAAQLGLPLWTLNGRFDDCAGKPALAELTRHVEAAKGGKPSYYAELIIQHLLIKELSGASASAGTSQ